MCRWEELSFLEGAGHWEFEHIPVSIWVTQIRPFFSFSFLFLLGWVGHKGEKQTWEDWEVGVCSWGAWCKIPK